MKYFFALIFVFIASSAVVLGEGCPPKFRPLGSGGSTVCVPSETGLSEKPVVDIINGVLTWILGIFGALGIIAFVVAGIFYLTAAGDAEQEKKSKKAMQMGIMGMIVGLSGFVIITAIDAILNARSDF